jgi:hypothetical protein
MLERVQVLLKNEYARSASHIGLQSTRVIEKVDDSTIVFTGVWQPGGWAAALLVPREVVIKRTWRRAAFPFRLRRHGLPQSLRLTQYMLNVRFCVSCRELISTLVEIITPP